MQWVREKEQWLADWADAVCIKEIVVGGADVREPAVAAKPPGELDTFFSEALEVAGRCWVARASGNIVEIFDISPGADSLACWRVRLPTPVERDVGLAHAVAPDGASLALLLLARGGSVHRVSLAVRGVHVEVAATGSTVCSVSEHPAAFCALSPELAAIGCFDGSLHIVRLRTSGPEEGPHTCQEHYELTSGALLSRLVGGMLPTSQPSIRALACAGIVPSSGFQFLGGNAFRLLSFADDNQLRLWEVGERKGRLVASQEVGGLTIAVSDIPRIRMSPSRSRACLVFGHAAYIIELPAAGAPDGLEVHEVRPTPFPRAAPSLVAMADDSLWAMWSGQLREQLFRLDLKPDNRAWEPRWLDAACVHEGMPEMPQVVPLAAAGSDTEQPGSHQVIFTLFQQQKIWKAEEEGFDAMRFADAAEAWASEAAAGAASSAAAGDEAGSAQSALAAGTVDPAELALDWWVGRIFIPGRYAAHVISEALLAAGGHLPAPTADGQPPSSRELRSAVEEHLKRRTALHCAYASPAPAQPIAAAGLETATTGDTFALGPWGQPANTSPVQVAMALAAEALELRQHCDVAWARSSQLCGFASSSTWAFHLWYPAGCLPEGEPLDRGAQSCLLLFSPGGVSLVRPVHSWTERWWATFHYSSELSQYDLSDLSGEPTRRVGLDDLLQLSDLDEWKLCATAWFLSLCLPHCASLGLAMGALPKGVAASAALRRMLQDVPDNLAAEVNRAASSMRTPQVGTNLSNVAAALRTLTWTQQRRVPVGDRTLDLTSGTWWSRFGAQVAMSLGGVCQTDVMRGSIALSECSSACVAMRDLQLLCLFACQSGDRMHDGPPREVAAELGKPGDWAELAELLDSHVPLYFALAQGMRCSPEARHGSAGVSSAAGFIPANRRMHPLAARACDLWAASFRGVLGGGELVCLRPPLASFRSYQFVMTLLRHECWDSLRHWLRHQGSREFVAYICGREVLAQRRPVAAKSCMLQAVPDAEALVNCLPRQGINLSLGTGAPAVLYYYLHCASLFGEKVAHEEELFFLSSAVQLTRENADVAHEQKQTVLTAYFEKAVNMERWDAACDALKEVEAFEAHLRLLGQRLRTTGCIDVVKKLTPQQKEFFLATLYEHASMSTPTAGSDSLACFQLLFALHFSSQEFLKAATVARLLYEALGRALERLSPHSVLAAGSPTAATPSWFCSGDCISDPAKVPMANGDSMANDSAEMEVDKSSEFRVSNGKDADAWSLLEQQRHALLMLVSTLSLTPERAVVVPPANVEGLGPVDAEMTDRGEEDPGFDELRAWFSGAEHTARDSIFTLEDARKQLGVVEAKLLLHGRDEVRTVGDIARCMASMGLLVLAVQLATTHNLDLWRFALQPFTFLCMDADAGSEGLERANVLVKASEGPAQSYMFVRTDGCEPLGGKLTGQTGEIAEGLWRTLDETLSSVAPCVGPETDRALDARGVRLYSLVADAVLSRTTAALPRFLSRPLSLGSSWICLLRLYMKHRRTKDAKELLENAAKRNKDMNGGLAKLVGASGRYPLQDLSLGLVAQLREGAAVAEKAAAKVAAAEASGVASGAGDGAAAAAIAGSSRGSLPVGCGVEAAWLQLEEALRVAERA